MKKTPSKENPFSGKKYIDDFASSSDEFSGISENENMLPMVELQDSRSYQPPSHSHRACNYNNSGEEYQLGLILESKESSKNRLPNDLSLSGVNSSLKHSKT